MFIKCHNDDRPSRLPLAVAVFLFKWRVSNTPNHISLFLKKSE
nr:MAG TPA: hypothetical protein [Herelleviridae sp.]